MSNLLIIPYFGKLPQYFPQFLLSCKYWKKGEMDILLITDDNAIDSMNIPECMTIKKCSFMEIQAKINETTGYSPINAYKLVDFKPLYGTIFAEYTEGYEYWGYCDVDTIMGDVVSWLNKINYTQYDRVGRYGHFTLYRNTPEITSLWKREFPDVIPLKQVFSTSYACHFDEIGMNQKCTRAKVSHFRGFDVINPCTLHSLHFRIWDNKDSADILQLFTWEKGHFYSYTKQNGVVEKVEHSYMHYMHRPVMPTHGEIKDDNMLITHEGFYPFNESQLDEYFERFGHIDTQEQRDKLFKELKENDRKGIIKRLKFELKTYGLIKGLRNLYNRFSYTLHLRRKGLD